MNGPDRAGARARPGKVRPAPAAYDPADDVTPGLERARARVRAPDVVLAVSRRGLRTFASGGTAARPPAARETLRCELGSMSKTFTVLLLAGLVRDGALSLDDPLAAHLPGLPLRDDRARRITLRHLATHTAGLPRVPHDLLLTALLRPYGDGYAGYDLGRLLDAFARSRVRHEPGSRWNYSNFGLALLGPALENATGGDYGDLLARRVLDPLALRATSVGPSPTGAAAVGHKPDGRTPLPPAEMAAFTPAGALLSTPADLLTYAEAHMSPESTPMAGALLDVQVPVLRRGIGHRHVHTLTWFLHPAPGGPVLFHAGATPGHQAFVGYHPATATAVAAVANRHDRLSTLVKAAYTLLYELASTPAGRP